MRFNIYGRFQVDVRRENDAWAVYRAVPGKRVPFEEVVIPADVPADELATWLDDIFHEYAGHGDMVEPIPD
ncbi:hypothetical protein ACEN9H_13030 [Massilia cellulosiltytica]|jgi:hypothetical protein|uniref:DUF7661 family protein n=1 Tax=Massilia cellulosiltytica TaxID=2683234 RepID=UPI0039B52DA3